MLLGGSRSDRILNVTCARSGQPAGTSTFLPSFQRGIIGGMAVQVFLWDRLTPRGKRIMKPLLAVVTLNLFAFFVGIAYLGGDAFSGKEENGHYYVSDHGQRTEVTHGQYVYSRTHGIVTMILMPLTMVVWGCLYFTGDYFPKSGSP